MIDKELEQAVLAVFEEALGGERARAAMESAGETRVKTTDESGSSEASVSAFASQIEGITGANRGFTTPASGNAEQLLETSTDRSGGVSIRSVAATVLKAGLGTAPLAHLVSRLFGGGGPEAPPPLVKYERPAPIRIERANRSAEDGRVSFAEFDYGQGGALRIQEQESRRAAGLPRTGPLSTDISSLPPTDVRVPQITVNVQAMDSRSFLDHSDDIARAVRDAMLNMHALNDVVSEL
jgi:hypothetical protein